MNLWRMFAALLPIALVAGCATPPAAYAPAQPAGLADPPLPPPPPPPPAQIDMQRMSEITRVLASDEFQGRAPGTPGRWRSARAAGMCRTESTAGRAACDMRRRVYVESAST